MYPFFCRLKRRTLVISLSCIVVVQLLLIALLSNDRSADQEKDFFSVDKKDNNVLEYTIPVTQSAKEVRARELREQEKPLSDEVIAGDDEWFGSSERERLPTGTQGSKGAETEWQPPPDAGENGQGVRINEKELSKSQLQKLKAGWDRHQFNQFASDLISLHRSLPEAGNVECLSVQYSDNLPETSVVIIFHNEAWSTLLRTVHSVLDRSPPHLLRQVILVDDASDLDHLKSPLDDYVSRLEKVKVVRMKSRQGLIVARLVGFSHVTTPTVLFLDSHCECAKGWLEPMLDRIAKDPTTVVVPIIDGINDHTFEYDSSGGSQSVGTFSWELEFDWISIQRGEEVRRKSIIDPIRTPTMAGGLFAIDTDFFTKLGTYDPGMKIWGGENLELSFKIWMCGGTMETIPCSHVGHVFRSKSPHSSGNFEDYAGVNLARLAAVWMDDYSLYLKDVAYDDKKYLGDISERQELRHRLKCHSFAWYMKNVLPERDFPADRIAHGPIINNLTGLCIDRGNEVAVLKDCTVNKTDWYMNANESTIIQENLGVVTNCLDYTKEDGVLTNNNCIDNKVNQLWKYSKDLQQLYHVDSSLCAEATTDKLKRKHDDQESFQLLMTQCDPSNPRQQWMWDTSPVPGPSWRKDMAAGIPVV